MNPDFLKYLQQITSALRGGLVFNPLDEMQKRAQQYGEGVGTQIEHDKAVAGYAQSHPESQRAQQENMLNAVKAYASMLKPETGAEFIPKDRPAIMRLKDGSYTDPAISHADAAMSSGQPLDSFKPSDEMFITSLGRKVSRKVAEQIQRKAQLIPKSVQNQMATRDQQAGKAMGMTAEDVRGKLYANRGTTADEPMTLDDLNRIMAKKKGAAALDSAVVGAARYGPTRTTVGPNDAVPPFWGTRLHSALTDKGGFTIDPETGADLKSGYSVGGGDKSGVLLKKPLADLKPTELQSFLNTNRSKLQPGQAWGGWVQDGHVYVEPADQVADVNEAQQLGNARGEQAIWDHANGKEIPLKAAKAQADAQAIAAKEPFRDVLDKWHTAWGDYTNMASQLPDVLQQRGADVRAAQQFPSSNASQPWLQSYIQRDIERPNGASPDKIAKVEDIAYKTFNTPQFKKWLAAGQGTGTWYDTRETMGRAIDALGEKLGPKAFNEFIDHLAASTAMSRPENNIRRASWWRALNLQGLLNPEELRSSTLAAPEGMGHIAQRAHHFATADLVEQGQVNPLANPKPASFAENLKMNQRPVTFDTRMSNAALSTEPKMSLALAGIRSDATPRKWAYAPIERAAQRVAAEAAQRGDLDPVPRGVDPTATWQAQVWGGIGRADKTRMMSVDNPSFHAIVDQLLARSAKLWGVSPTKANELFWKGQPLDLPLDASLLKGPSRKR